MELLCRLCLEVTLQGKVENIFTYTLNNSKESFVNVLSQVFEIEIDATEQFQKYVCLKCIKIIEYVLSVRNTFQICQENLRKSIMTGEKIVSVADQLKNSTENLTEYYQKSEPSNEKTPFIRVPLESLDTMCQLSVNLTTWENSLDSMSYKRLANGAYKPRKQRHFKLDDNLINDICSFLDDNTRVDHYDLRRDVGTNTDEPFNTCNCKDYKSTNNITKTINLPSAANIENVYDRIKLKRKVSANTLRQKATGLDEHQKNENSVRVGIRDSIRDLCYFPQPKVALEPVEHLIKREKYAKLRKNCYYIGSSLKNESDNQYRNNRNSKKINPFAFQDLIAAKTKFQSQVFEVTKVRTVSVCNFCSKSFLSNAGLKRHYKWKHQTLLDKIENEALVEKAETTRLSIKSGGNNMARKRTYNRKRRLEIRDDSETETGSECETETNGAKHNRKELEGGIQSVIPYLLDHDYGQSPKKNEKCEALFKDIENSANNINNENSERICDNSIDSPSKTLRSTRQRASNTDTNISPRVKRLNQLNTVTSTSENSQAKESYIWERNCLGTYSAINFLKQSSASQSNIPDTESRKDLSLNETILKLAGRLDDPV